MDKNRNNGQQEVSAPPARAAPENVDEMQFAHLPHSLTEGVPALGGNELVDVASGLRDTMKTWRRVGEQLAALIGESGFCALFERAVRMRATRYGWLSVDPARRSIDTLLAAFEQDLARTSDAEAAMANTELLHTFTKQLSTLIGEALTSRLLKEAVASTPELPDAQEQD